MHGRLHHPTDTQRRDRQSGGCLTWSIAVVLALGLALGIPPRTHARTFECGAGDVDCLITTIETANANGQTNTIRLEAGTYILTEIYNETPPDFNGLPVITSRLTIQGAGAESTIIERDAPFDTSFFFRLLQVAATGSLTLQRLTLRDGVSGDGGGIYNAGTLTLTDCILTANLAFHANGGGIYNAGTATLINSTLAANGSYFGGGISNTGTLTLTDCTLTDNRARYGGGGIDNDGTLTLTNSTLTANVADSGYTSGGGGIYNAGTVTLTNATLAYNTAFSGAGIDNDGTVTLTNSTLAHNTATFGGGIYNMGTLTLTNATLTANVADHGSADPFATGAGVANYGSATLQNTILALNTAPNTLFPSDDCVGGITSLGNNLIGDATTGQCTLTLQASDLTGDPGLGDFTDDGTPGNGHVPLLPTSRAIDAGNDTACPRADQLGQPRVNIPQVGTSRCDIGAIEFPPQNNGLSSTAQATP